MRLELVADPVVAALPVVVAVVVVVVSWVSLAVGVVPVGRGGGLIC